MSYRGVRGAFRASASFVSLATTVIALGACGRVAEDAGGTFLVRAGQQPDAVYGVLNGALRTVRRGDGGVERTVHGA